MVVECPHPDWLPFMFRYYGVVRGKEPSRMVSRPGIFHWGSQTITHLRSGAFSPRGPQQYPFIYPTICFCVLAVSSPFPILYFPLPAVLSFLYCIPACLAGIHFPFLIVCIQQVTRQAFIYLFNRRSPFGILLSIVPFSFSVASGLEAE